MLKDEIKVWNKEVFGVVETNIEKKRIEIKCLDRIDDVMGLDESEDIKRNQSKRYHLVGQDTTPKVQVDMAQICKFELLPPLD